jgi:hypothetical protein
MASITRRRFCHGFIDSTTLLTLSVLLATILGSLAVVQLAERSTENRSQAQACQYDTDCTGGHCVYGSCVPNPTPIPTLPPGVSCQGGFNTCAAAGREVASGCN